jgi:hypothetical protein
MVRRRWRELWSARASSSHASPLSRENEKSMSEFRNEEFFGPRVRISYPKIERSEARTIGWKRVVTRFRRMMSRSSRCS